MLDFGCGCGRVLALLGRVHDGTVAGSDRDGGAVDWCRSNLAVRARRAERARAAARPSRTRASTSSTRSPSSRTSPPSCSAHGATSSRRVLRPGGRLLVTTHGRSYVPRLEPDERARFERGELVVRWGDLAGQRTSAARTTPSATSARRSPRASTSSSSSRKVRAATRRRTSRSCGSSARQRDLAQPGGAVDVETAQLSEAHRRHLTGDDGGERAQPLGHARRRAASGVCARSSSAGTSETASSRAPARRAPDTTSTTLVVRGSRRSDDDHRPAGLDRSDRAVHEIGRRVRLDDEPRQLADLERDLVRRCRS